MPPPVNKETCRFLQAMVPVWMRIDLDVAQGGRPRDGMKSIRQAAEDLGVPYPSLAKLIRRGEGVGMNFEDKVAELRFGGDVSRLRREAKEWAAAHPEKAEKPEPYVERAPRYPSLERAIAARPWSDGAIAEVRSSALDADEDPGERHWIERLERAETALKLARQPFPKLPDRGVDPLADLDESAGAWPPKSKKKAAKR